MELLASLGYDTFGPFLGSMLTNILSNRADSGLKQLETLLAAKLQDGQLPANHDLQQAVLDALRQALRSLGLALADSHFPASPFLREVRRQLLNPQDRASSVTTLLDVPLWTALDRTERGWIDAFARLLDDNAALSRLAGLGLAAEGGVDALLEPAPASRRGERLQLAVTEWLDRELRAIPGRPAMLDDYLALGWPVAERPAELSAITPSPHGGGLGWGRDESEASLPVDRPPPSLPPLGGGIHSTVLEDHATELSAITPSPHGGGLGWGRDESEALLPVNRPPPGLPPLGGGTDSEDHSAEFTRIKLFQAWCWFFREAIKERPKLFNIYVAETLTDLKRQLSATRPDLAPALAQLPPADLASFGNYLTAEFADLKHWLDRRFDRLGVALENISDKQDVHTGLLRTLLTEIGGFPALWRAQRWWRYGFISFAVLLLAGGGFILYQNAHLSELTAAAVQHSFDAKLVATRLRTEIEERFQQDRAKAIAAGQHWDTLRELEKQRDTALSKVDDVITTIEQGLSGQPDPVFVEASRILQAEGTDAALGYLDSHKAERRTRVERDKASAEAAEDKLRQDAQALFLEAELRQTRYDWEQALAALREAANTAPHWWQTRLRLGRMLRESAHYAEAQPQLQMALALAEQDTDRATAMNELALLYMEQSHWAEAEPLFRQALEIVEKIYGPEHPSVAVALNNLATLMYATKRLAEAEPLMKKALAIDEKSFGPEHPDVARDLNNLALLLQDTNRLGEAEPLMRRALAIVEKSYGPEHPKVAIRLNNLAQLLQDTNRLDEAEPLMRKALAIDEKSYGPEHPDVARDLNNLAQLLQDTNRLAEAEPLMKRALAIDEKSYGPKHPNVAIRLNNLALLLLDTNRLAEAEPLMRRTLAIDEKSYGPEHPAVARDLNNLARLLKDTKRLDEAEPLERRAMLILLKSTRAAGHELPNLRGLYGNYQVFLAAQKLKPPAIAQRLESLGPEAGYTPEEWAAVRAAWAQVRVAGVIPGSQAEALGLQAGDVITRYAGENITSNARLIELTSHIKTPAIPLTILRAGEPITLTAQPGKLGVQLE